MSQRRFGRVPGGVSSLRLHVGWCSKYRRRILDEQVARHRDERVERVADECGRQMVAKEVMPDHMPLFVRVGPTDAPALVTWASKVRSARGLPQEFPRPRNRARMVRLPSYFAVSVARVSESRVRGSFEHRSDAVIAS